MFCEAQNLKGAARWLRLQWNEELEHAMRFVNHVHARGGTVTLQAIPAPPASFGSLKELFYKVLEHERKVTAFDPRIVCAGCKRKRLCAPGGAAVVYQGAGGRGGERHGHHVAAGDGRGKHHGAPDAGPLAGGTGGGLTAWQIPLSPEAISNVGPCA